MTKRILLSGTNPEGLCAIVDDEDFERASAQRWYVHRAKRSLTVYAKGKPVSFLHRLIMNAGPGEEIDHADGDGLNCTRRNLEKVTHAENCRRVKKQAARRDFDAWESVL